MQHVTRYRLLATVVLTVTLLAISVGRPLVHREAAQLALNNWNIPELAEHLNRTGLKVRLCSTQKNGGGFDRAAYLTITDKDWNALNHLSKAPKQIQEWRGTVYCECRGEGEPGFHLMGNHYLAAGPFVFYGDAELLEGIRAILMPSESPPAL